MHTNADRLAEPFSDITQTWSALQQQICLKPIRNDADYQQMVQVARDLEAHLNGNGDTPLAGLLSIVNALISAWETHHVPATHAEPREVLRHLLKTHGLRQKDLADIAAPTVVSDILAGRRAISKNVAKALAARFHMDVGIFL